jgi:hypothetical protein
MFTATICCQSSSVTFPDWRRAALAADLAGAEELAHGGDQLIDARVRFSEAPVRFAIARGGLQYEGVEVGGDRVDASGQLVELPLGVAPEAAEFLAILAALFGQVCGDTLDACEAFVYGQALSPA